MSRFKKIAIFIALAAALLLSLPRLSSNKDRLVERSRIAMGTFVSVKVPERQGDDPRRIDSAIDMAFDEISRVEGVFSAYRDESEISRINRLRQGEPLRISAEAFSLIEESLYYSARTEGAFDITVGPLVKLWSQARSAGREPAEDEIKAAMAKVGYKNVFLDRMASSITLGKSDMALDMGGVAKGYAADRAVKVLRDNGIKDAIVDCGGDIFCIGQRQPGRPWKVGVRHPRKKGGLLMEIELKDKAIDTSGDYEKFFMLNGRRYSHIIDPRTGYPADEGAISATVVSDKGSVADILATALCVLGPGGISTAASGGSMAVVVTVKDGKLAVETAGALEGVSIVSSAEEV